MVIGPTGSVVSGSTLPATDPGSSDPAGSRLSLLA